MTKYFCYTQALAHIQVHKGRIEEHCQTTLSKQLKKYKHHLTCSGFKGCPRMSSIRISCSWDLRRGTASICLIRKQSTYIVAYRTNSMQSLRKVLLADLSENQNRNLQGTP